MLTPKRLVSLFLRESIAAAAGAKVGRLSIAKLGELTMEMRYCDIQDNINSFFDSLIPYRRFNDFQTLASLPRPRPLQLLVEPHIFYGHLRSWLRRRGFNPDRGELHRDEMKLASAERKRTLMAIRRADAQTEGTQRRGRSRRRPPRCMAARNVGSIIWNPAKGPALFLGIIPVAESSCRYFPNS